MNKIFFVIITIFLLSFSFMALFIDFNLLTMGYGVGDFLKELLRNWEVYGGIGAVFILSKYGI